MRFINPATLISFIFSFIFLTTSSSSQPKPRKFRKYNMNIFNNNNLLKNNNNLHKKIQKIISITQIKDLTQNLNKIEIEIEMTHNFTNHSSSHFNNTSPKSNPHPSKAKSMEQSNQHKHSFTSQQTLPRRSTSSRSSSCWFSSSSFHRRLELRHHRLHLQQLASPSSSFIRQNKIKFLFYFYSYTFSSTLKACALTKDIVKKLYILIFFVLIPIPIWVLVELFITLC